MSHFNIKSWEETSMNAKKREISQATGINLNLLKNEKNLINVNKSSFNSFANSVGINKNSQLDRYALYQVLKSYPKTNVLNTNTVKQLYNTKKEFYNKYKINADPSNLSLPEFIIGIGQTSDARISTGSISNRVSGETKTIYKLLGGKDDLTKYTGNKVFKMNNRNLNRNRNQRTDSSGPFLAAGVTLGLGLIGTGVYFLLGK